MPALNEHDPGQVAREAEAPRERASNRSEFLLEEFERRLAESSPTTQDIEEMTKLLLDLEALYSSDPIRHPQTGQQVLSVENAVVSSISRIALVDSLHFCRDSNLLIARAVNGDQAVARSGIAFPFDPISGSISTRDSRVLPLPGHELCAVASSAASSNLAVASRSSIGLFAISRKDGAPVFEISGNAIRIPESERIVDLQFSSNGQFLAATYLVDDIDSRRLALQVWKVDSTGDLRTAFIYNPYQNQDNKFELAKFIGFGENSQEALFTTVPIDRSRKNPMLRSAELDVPGSANPSGSKVLCPLPSLGMAHSLQQKEGRLLYTIERAGEFSLRIYSPAADARGLIDASPQELRNSTAPSSANINRAEFAGSRIAYVETPVSFPGESYVSRLRLFSNHSAGGVISVEEYADKTDLGRSVRQMTYDIHPASGDIAVAIPQRNARGEWDHSLLAIIQS